MTRNTEVEPV